MNNLLKNTLGIVAALAIGAILINQLRQMRNIEPPSEASQITQSVAPVQYVDVNAERLRNESQIRAIYKTKIETEISLSNLEAYLERDKKRIFRRIPHDSLPIYGGMIAKYQNKVTELDGRLNRMGFDENNIDHYPDGYKPM